MTELKLPEETQMSEIPDYTPTFIDWDQNQLRDDVIQGLITESRNCNLSAGITMNPNIGTDAFDPFGMPASSTVTRALILVIDSAELAAISSRGQKLIEVFNSGSGLQTLGHCFITWDKMKNICGIWDVCLHTGQQKGKGLGSLLVDKIIESLATHVSTTTQLWLGVDLQNKQFGKVANLYAKFGFSNPFISYVDPFGKNHKDSLPLGFVSLQRPNDYIDPTEINRTSIMAEITYMIMEYLRVAYFRLADQHSKDNLTKLESYKLVNKGIETEMPRQSCVLQVYFYHPYAKWLKSLSLSASTLNPDGTVTQKEFSGSFSLDNPIVDDQTGTVVWAITKDPTRLITIGDEDTTQIVQSRYNFHTHPLEVYKKWEVQLGYPSGPDYAEYFRAAILNKTVFHSVIAIEGIYTISLGRDWRKNLNSLYKYIMGELITVGDEKFNLYGYIREFMEFDKHKFQKDYISNTTNPNLNELARRYCDEVTKKINPLSFINPQAKPLFACQFLSWDQIETTKHVLSIPYPTLHDQCFATERSLQALERLHSAQ